MHSLNNVTAEALVSNMRNSKGALRVNTISIVAVHRGVHRVARRTDITEVEDMEAGEDMGEEDMEEGEDMDHPLDLLIGAMTKCRIS